MKVIQLTFVAPPNHSGLINFDVLKYLSLTNNVTRNLIMLVNKGDLMY